MIEITVSCEPSSTRVEVDDNGRVHAVLGAAGETVAVRWPGGGTVVECEPSGLPAPSQRHFDEWGDYALSLVAGELRPALPSLAWAQVAEVLGVSPAADFGEPEPSGVDLGALRREVVQHLGSCERLVIGCSAPGHARLLAVDAVRKITRTISVA